MLTILPADADNFHSEALHHIFKLTLMEDAVQFYLFSYITPY